MRIVPPSFRSNSTSNTRPRTGHPAKEVPEVKGSGPRAVHRCQLCAVTSSGREHPLSGITIFDVSSNPSSTGLGAYFRRIRTERICADRLAYTTWTLDSAVPGFGRAAAQELARYYVGLTDAWEHP